MQVDALGSTRERGAAVGGMRGTTQPRPRLPQSAAATMTETTDTLRDAKRARGSPTERRAKRGRHGPCRTQFSGAGQFALLLLLAPTSAQLQAKVSGHPANVSNDVSASGAAETSVAPRKKMMMSMGRAAGKVPATLADADRPLRGDQLGLVRAVEPAVTARPMAGNATNDTCDPSEGP